MTSAEDKQQWKDAPPINKAIALLVVVGLPLFLAWQCASAFTGSDDDRPRLTPSEVREEQRELDDAKRTVETACALWWEGAIELSDDHAQICIDGNYGR